MLLVDPRLKDKVHMHYLGGGGGGGSLVNVMKFPPIFQICQIP